MVPRCSATWRAEYSRTTPEKRSLSMYSWTGATLSSNGVTGVVSVTGASPSVDGIEVRVAVAGDSFVYYPDTAVDTRLASAGAAWRCLMTVTSGSFAGDAHWVTASTLTVMLGIVPFVSLNTSQRSV